MNRLVFAILLIQCSLALLVALIGIHWYEDDYTEVTYLNLTTPVGTNFIETFFSYFLLLNTLIPISLIVTIEVVKQWQAYFIVNDYQLYTVETNLLRSLLLA